MRSCVSSIARISGQNVTTDRKQLCEMCRWRVREVFPERDGCGALMETMYGNVIKYVFNKPRTNVKKLVGVFLACLKTDFPP